MTVPTGGGGSTTPRSNPTSALATADQPFQTFTDPVQGRLSLPATVTGRNPQGARHGSHTVAQASPPSGDDYPPVRLDRRHTDHLTVLYEQGHAIHAAVSGPADRGKLFHPTVIVGDPPRMIFPLSPNEKYPPPGPPSG